MSYFPIQLTTEGFKNIGRGIVSLAAAAVLFILAIQIGRGGSLTFNQDGLAFKPLHEIEAASRVNIEREATEKLKSQHKHQESIAEITAKKDSEIAQLIMDRNLKACREITAIRLDSTRRLINLTNASASAKNSLPQATVLGPSEVAPPLDDRNARVIAAIDALKLADQALNPLFERCGTIH